MIILFKTTIVFLAYTILIKNS